MDTFPLYPVASKQAHLLSLSSLFPMFPRRNRNGLPCASPQTRAANKSTRPIWALDPCPQNAHTHHLQPATFVGACSPLSPPPQVLGSVGWRRRVPSSMPSFLPPLPTVPRTSFVFFRRPFIQCFGGGVDTSEVFLCAITTTSGSYACMSRIKHTKQAAAHLSVAWSCLAGRTFLLATEILYRWDLAPRGIGAVENIFGPGCQGARRWPYQVSTAT